MFSNRYVWYQPASFTDGIIATSEIKCKTGLVFNRLHQMFVIVVLVLLGRGVDAPRVAALISLVVQPIDSDERPV